MKAQLNYSNNFLDMLRDGVFVLNVDVTKEWHQYVLDILRIFGIEKYVENIRVVIGEKNAIDFDYDNPPNATIELVEGPDILMLGNLLHELGHYRLHVDGIIGSYVEVFLRGEVDERTKRKIKTHSLRLLLTLGEFINERMIVERLNDMPHYLRDSYEFLMETSILDLANRGAGWFAEYARGRGFFFLAVSSLILEEVYKKYFTSANDRHTISNIEKAMAYIENGCRLANLHKKYLIVKHHISSMMRQLPSIESLTSKHVEEILKSLLEMLLREAIIEEVSHIEYGKYMVLLSTNC